MIISEIFQSHQGEGVNIGTYCTFIRLSGCNLSCSFCDTKYAKNGYETRINDILPKLTSHIVFTGGEPFLQEDVIYEILDAVTCYSEIETNGIIIPKHPDKFDLITVSPKTDINYQEWLDCPNAVFKFATNDITQVLDIITREGIPEDIVYVMPVTSPSESPIPIHQKMAADCREHGLNFSPRLQVLLGWGMGL